jgi:hypothetical protein
LEINALEIGAWHQLTRCSAEALEISALEIGAWHQLTRLLG